MSRYLSRVSGYEESVSVYLEAFSGKGVRELGVSDSVAACHAAYMGPRACAYSILRALYGDTWEEEVE